MTQSERQVLRRIRSALEAAQTAFAELPPEPGPVQYKSPDNPVCSADRLLNDVLRQHLQNKDELWFSEEDQSDCKLGPRGRVWVVDPLDGTREYLAGVPEWCISVALVEHGRGVAAGICNPRTGEMFLGSPTTGVTYNGRKAAVGKKRSLAGALVLASRSESRRGEWERFRGGGFRIQAVGSVAYKLARVAAGLADATWTLVPKHVWDVAAGTILVEAAGGFVCTPEGAPLKLEPPDAAVQGLAAGARGLRKDVFELLAGVRPPAQVLHS